VDAAQEPSQLFGVWAIIEDNTGWCGKYGAGDGAFVGTYDEAEIYRKRQARDFPNCKYEVRPYHAPTPPAVCDRCEGEGRVQDINLERRSCKRCKGTGTYPPSLVQPTPPATVEGDGPWIIEQVGDECLLHNPTLSVAEVRTFKVSRNGITWLRDILNKQHAENRRLREALQTACDGVETCLKYPRGSEAQVQCFEEHGFDMAAIKRQHLAKAGGR
jgi:hypothetical protein